MTRPKILVTSAAGRTGSTYVEIPTEVWLEQIAKARFMNPHFLKHLEQVAADHRDGFFGSYLSENAMVDRALGSTLY